MLCVRAVSLSLLGFAMIVGGANPTGYWQYVKTDSYINLYANQTGGNPAKPYPDTYTGSEGNLTVVVGTGSQTFRFGANFLWSRPPSILIPGTALFWPATATITQNTGNNPPYLGFGFSANLYPYASVEDLTASPGYSSPYLIEFTPDSGLGSGNPAGTVLNYNNATLASPTLIPVGGGPLTDINGQMSILLVVSSSSYFYWNYVYQWVPTPQGACGGTCTLASSGQAVGVSGGPGSIAITASGTWNVVSPDGWITVTSATSGAGNSTVTFTVSPNTGGQRSGSLIIGGQQYTISQAGTASSTGSGGGAGLGTTNIALSKPVTVSSQYPTITGNPANITANPFASQWFAYQGMPSYCSIVVDLGQIYKIGAIEIQPLQTFDYQVYGSTDGTTYTQIATHTWPAWVNLPVSIPVNGASSARYIKYTAHTAWNQYIGLGGMRIFEWLASAPVPQPSSAYGTTDVAQGKTVQNLTGYTSDPANPPSNVVDGSLTSAWYGTNSTPYNATTNYNYDMSAGGVLIDLGQQISIGKIVVTPAKAQGFGMYLTNDTTTPANFLFASDQTMFTTANTGLAAQTFTVDGRITARYVWLYAWNLVPGSTPVNAGLNEIQVYAFNGSSSTCSYSLSPTSASPAAAGGSATVTVTAGSGCTWTANSNASWITITAGASGTGNGTVSYNVAANTGAARSGTMTIAGATFTVNQAAASVSTGSCAGTCSINAPGQTIGVSGGTGSIVVTATSAWTAVSQNSWITISSGASGSGNGTVSFTVAANTGPPQTGTIAVAGFTYTIFQNGTATGVTAGCSYLIQSNTTQEVPAGGTSSGFIQIVTAQNCAWTASSTVSWISIISGSAVTGNGAVAYTVPANTTGIPRSGGIVIDGQMVAINQDGGVAAGTPVISAGGIVNTASYAGPPLAQGSYFSIYGSSLGPATGVKASAYPLPTSLGGVGVHITSGSSGYDAYMVYAGAGQINAILPSNVPVGSAQVTVTYNNLTSAPATITVAATALGIFYQVTNGANMAIAQNYVNSTSAPLNLPAVPATPGQIVILWGTGMGAVTGGDNIAPPAGDMTNVPMTITVGGVTAARLYAGRQPQTAGVDNVYFTVPSGVPYGCNVPVAITAGGVAANTTNIAITADGSACH